MTINVFIEYDPETSHFVIALRRWDIETMTFSTRVVVFDVFQLFQVFVPSIIQNYGVLKISYNY